MYRLSKTNITILLPKEQFYVRVQIGLYKNVSSCVMNNGFTSAPFSLSREVRQGDLTPFLPIHHCTRNFGYTDKK